jgi:glycosyltransferase involved in cell wall biosynthesis
MSIGMPPVALATTEIPQLIIDGYTGFSSLNLEYLIDKMKYLLMDKGMAEKLGKAAQNKVENDYSIRDFKEKWFRTINLVKTGVFNERPEFLKKVNSFDNNTI